MPLFKCSKCNCVDNTATGFYWGTLIDGKLPLCAECGPPELGGGKWHNVFPKREYKGEPLEPNGWMLKRDIS